MKKTDSKKEIQKTRFHIEIMVGILLLLLCSAVFIFSLVAVKDAKHNKNGVKKQSFKIIAINKKIISSPTVTVTPIPKIKYTGYCLNVPILMYHHIQPESLAKETNQSSLSVDNGYFDRQMAYIAGNGYSVITAQQLVDALRAHSSLPAKSIVITIDDGYKDIYDYAFPILKKYNIAASLMIPTGLMNGADYLTWDQISDMNNSGLINFTDHTWSHYSLGKGDRTKIKYEIETAKSQLEQHTGKTIDLFTYPYGSEVPEAIKVLQEDGFLGAFSTIPGTYQCDSFILSLHRTRIGNAPLSAYGL